MKDWGLFGVIVLHTTKATMVTWALEIPSIPCENQAVHWWKQKSSHELGKCETCLETCLCYPDSDVWGIPKMQVAMGSPKSSIFVSDFPWSKASGDWGTPMTMEPQVRTTETLMGKAPSRIDQSLAPKRGPRVAQSTGWMPSLSKPCIYCKGQQIVTIYIYVYYSICLRVYIYIYTIEDNIII